MKRFNYIDEYDTVSLEDVKAWIDKEMKAINNAIDYIDGRIKSCEYLSNENFKLSKKVKHIELRIRCEVIADCYKREIYALHEIRRLLKANLNTSDETIKGGESND